MPTTPWPSSLPQRPRADDFAETPPNLLVRSTTDTGPAKVRRRTTAGVTKMRASFRLTAAQLAAFRSFYEIDIEHGALPFSWTHPITGASGLFRIVEPPTYEAVANGLAWRLSVVFEILP